MKSRENKNQELTQEDFDKIYKEYYQRVYEFTLKRVSDTYVAEDLTSSVFEKMIRSIGKFKWRGVTIGAWIFKIARNNIIDYYRKSNKRKNDVSIQDVIYYLKSDEKDSITELVDDEKLVKLYNAIREFSERDQYLIYYKYFEGLQNKQIARVMKMTESNIATRLHRIRKKMKELLIFEDKLKNVKKSEK